MAKKTMTLKEMAEAMATMPAGLAKQEKQARAIDQLQEALMLAFKQKKPYEVPVKAPGDVVEFGVVADTQIGSLYSLPDAVRAFYDRVRAEGIKIVFHAGDVLDGWRVYKGQEFELRPDGKSWAEQRAIFEAEMPRCPGVETIFITGNHDASFTSSVGLRVGDELQRARPDWKFIGSDVGDIELTTKSGKKYRVCLLHPGGGTAYAVSYHLQKIIEAWGGKRRPDLLVVGHYHKSLFMPAYRGVSSLLGGTLCSQTSFMVRQSIQAHVGGWIVRAWINEPEKLSGRIVTEWCGFKEEQKP